MHNNWKLIKKYRIGYGVDGVFFFAGKFHTLLATSEEEARSKALAQLQPKWRGKTVRLHKCRESRFIYDPK